jgi:type II secretory pathway pseudopilin PulG
MPSLPQSLRRANARHGSNPEAGYILIAVLFLVALVLLTLAIAAPKMAQSIQRDRELELIHRGEQYKRAIKLYYAKFHAYPSSIDQLVNTNQVRFLRKRYTDPMTGKDDWKIIHFGEAHVKAMGLFGQPIATTTTAGSSVPSAMGPGGLTGSGGTGGVGTIGTGMGSITSTMPGGTDGSGSSSGVGSSGSTGGSSTNGSTTGGTSGLSSGGLSSGGLSSGGLGSGTGNTNPTLGGGPMVGFAIPNAKASIKEYKQQKHYNEWEFVYDPAEDQLQAGTLFGGAAQNVNGQGTTNGIGGGVGGGLGGGIGTGTGTTPYSGGIGSGGTGSSGTGNSGPGSPTPQ